MSVAFFRSAGNAPSCSGRHPLSSANASKLQLYNCSCGIVRRKCVVVLSLYNFADAAETRVPGQRRNRGLGKKQARELMEVVRGLTSMTTKQLAAVAHLLPPGTVEAVGIAARLPRSNQGRKRQEGLVAKMLRGQLSEQQLDKLEEAVTLAEDNSGVFVDGEVSGLMAAWQEGLLREDQAVLAEVYGYPTEWAPDHQQLRSLVRQCQQAFEEEELQEETLKQQQQQQQPLSQQAPLNLVGSSSINNSSGDRNGRDSRSGDEDDGQDNDWAEVLAGTAGGLRRRKGGPERRSKGLVRSLSRMLRPLAVRVVQEGMAGA